MQNHFKEVPGQCHLRWELNTCEAMKQWPREKPSSKYTPSQKLAAEGKPPQIPNTCYLIHVARDACETVLILTDPHPNSEDKGHPQRQRCSLAGTDHRQACPCQRGAGRAAGHTATDPQGCSASGFYLCPWDRTTLTVPALQPSPAVQAPSTQGNILPVDWEKVGAAAAALLCYSALSSECNYPKHKVIRHNLQSLQLFGIPVYWLTDRICSRMQEIEHSNYTFTLRGRFKS